jgi:hypothetical protein
MRVRSFGYALVALLCLISVGFAQQLTKKMSNQDVVDMVALGLSDDVVIDKIHAADGTSFDTSVPALKKLKAASVSDQVIRAMINPKPALLPVSAAASNVPRASASWLPDEAGVYVMIKGKLTEVEPEVVGWQTGGIMKSMATGGLTKGHINGKIMKPKSPIQVPTPVEVYIRTPEGTSVGEYQLLKLDEKGNRREFRALTGGIIHASVGSEKNSVAMEPEKVAKSTWRIKLADLRKGEYGFLPPGLSSQSISSAGKIYTFGVIE